jgi:excisionase family DNA binding protein
MSKRISVPEIVAELGVSENHAYKMLRDGIIPNVRAGRIYIVSRAAFYRWLDTCGEARNAEAAFRSGAQPVGVLQ